MIVVPTGFLDFWTLLVILVFGSFWMTIIGLMLAMFVIMGPLGRISVYDCVIYLLMFLFIMTLGYGYSSIALLVTLIIFVGFVYSLVKYLDNR